ncbi:unannotated protein [freshwater metagenome]|uniref:Unannotated protein n=1 Tax=freshwater metagenome TaxID=449393 RepID=A0A6J7AD40_9ZZZZ|nr:UDP-N-acetylmuramoyl-L-alanyl-D-glutamate--2,6-diaminopimelate ligase [Actinomycetota bacterium]
MERPLFPVTKSLASIASLLGVQTKSGDLLISGMTHNSTEIQEGDLFLAFAGEKFHGARFAKDAKKLGAKAVLTDAEGSMLCEGMPVVVVENPRSAAGDLSAWFYGEPTRDIFSVGITGTNGKTTTSTLLHQIWTHAGHESGLIGTVETRIGRDVVASKRTTPESADLQALVATMRERHVRNLAMEVSSHAMSLSRIKGSHFNIAAFTNLTQDHLDFHHTMEEYFQAKASFFTFEYADLAIINGDTEFGIRLLGQTQLPTVRISRYDAKADWSYVNAVATSAGFDVAIRGVGGILIEGSIPFHGNFNLDNVLLAVAIAFESGVDSLDIAGALAVLTGAQGRLEPINIGQNFRAFVDYAHSPDAVSRVLSACREMTDGKVIAVLGCGGDRDSSKRPLMGEALVAGSDIAIFTSDNPRSEDPEKILRQMVDSLELSTTRRVVLDRKTAIEQAVKVANDGDVVIILGKGHELGQEILGIIHPFDDRLLLAQAIEGRS